MIGLLEDIALSSFVPVFLDSRNAGDGDKDGFEVSDSDRALDGDRDGVLDSGISISLSSSFSSRICRDRLLPYRGRHGADMTCEVIPETLLAQCLHILSTGHMAGHQNIFSNEVRSEACRLPLAPLFLPYVVNLSIRAARET